MIVSEVAKFVFLHNPKAGGTSVRTALLPWDTRNNHFWGIVFDAASNWNVDKAHLPIHVLARLYPGVREFLDEFFVFGFCRHPIERFVSAFNERFPDVYSKLRAEQLTMDEYASRLNAYAQEFVKGGQWNPNFTHATPQKGLFYDGNKCLADLIIPIEQPHPRVQALPGMMGRAGAAVLGCFQGDAQRRNARGLKQDSSVILAPETLKALEDYYSEDFRLFGYERSSETLPSS